MKKRHVKVDPWALFELHDRHHLTPHEALVLFTLVLHADWNQKVWEGSRGELATLASGMSTNTVRGATDRLAELGLIESRQRFRPNGRGRLYVACYDEVVVPNLTRNRADRRDPPDDDSGTRAEAAHEPRTNRAVQRG